MGEYIIRGNDSIKLGTCESLYYARYEDLKRVLNAYESNEYLNETNGYRYRFPFPEEDKIKIGDYEDYDKGLLIRGDEFNLNGIDHYTICRPVEPNCGGYNVNVMFPCIYDTKFNLKSSPIFPNLVEIVAQRLQNGELWTVVRCPYCHAMIRIDWEEAQKLINDINKNMIDERFNNSTKEYWEKVIERIENGYLINK